MTQTEIQRVRDVPFDAVKEIIKSDEHKTTAGYLINDFADLTIDGRNEANALLNVYCLALENVTDSAVTSFLCAVDDTEMFRRLTTGIFSDIAAKQKKKTAFERIVHDEWIKRKKREKEEEKEQRRLDREAFLATQPDYYGGKLTQTAVEQILHSKSLSVRLNLATKKIELHGHTEVIFAQYSKDNIMSTLPTLLLDECKNNEVGGGKASVNAINAYLFNLADANRYNPIRDMLESHENTDARHLETVYKILGLQRDFDKTLVRKWLIQTVAFAFADLDNPVSTEGVLVLQGSQGCGKTSFFRTLAGDPLWFTEGTVIDVRNKDSLLTAINGWICELGEIDSTLRKEQSALKAFITRTVDKIRLPYAPTDSDMPRTTSLCGTVNPEQFLKDSTGNRRYWTIHVENIDKRRLFALKKEDVFAIWGYVYHLYRQNKEGFRLNDVEFQQLEISNRAYSAFLPFEEEVMELLDFDISADRWRWTSPVELAPYIQGAKAEQIGRVLTKLSKENAEVKKRRGRFGYQYNLPLNSWTAGKLKNYSVQVCM